MTAETLLSRLENVSRTGQGKWIARCPSHEDRSPSLAIKETDDGTILLRCFAGCEVSEILGAIAMDASDLFPPRPEVHAVKGVSRFNAYQALRCLADDGVVLLAAARMLLRREPLTDSDIERLSLSVGRFQEARTYVLGVKK